MGCWLWVLVLVGVEWVILIGCIGVKVVFG